MAEKTESTVPFLDVAGLTKTYGRPPVETHVLRGVSLSMQEGDAVAIMGASGSGKSTLLNIIGALDEPSGGHVRFEGPPSALCSSGTACCPSVRPLRTSWSHAWRIGTESTRLRRNGRSGL